MYLNQNWWCLDCTIFTTSHADVMNARAIPLCSWIIREPDGKRCACIECIEHYITVLLWQIAVVTPWMMMSWSPICPCSLRYALIDGLVVAVHHSMTHRRIAVSFAAGFGTIGSAVLMSRSLQELRLDGSLAVASGRWSSSGTFVILPNIFPKIYWSLTNRT